MPRSRTIPATGCTAGSRAGGWPSSAATACTGRRRDTEGGTGIVVEVLPRRNYLARIDARGNAEPVAANLTQIVAVLAPVPTPDFGLCDRYLAAAEWNGLAACVVANKSDLTDDAMAGSRRRSRTTPRIGYVVRARQQAP